MVFACDVAGQQLELPEIGERFEALRLFRRAAGDPNARAAREQAVRDVIADMTGAAESRNQLAGQG